MVFCSSVHVRSTTLTRLLVYADSAMPSRIFALGSILSHRHPARGPATEWGHAPLLVRYLQALAPTASAEIWSWGSGSSGQLGHGDEKDERSPRRVSDFSVSVPVITAAANGEREPEGNDPSSTQNIKGRQMRNPDDGYGVACGLYHSACWAGGRLWLWGKGDAGRLGQGDEISRYSPTLNEFLPNVRCAALGGLHSIALAEERVYSRGFGGFGALGHGAGQFGRELTPKEVDGPWLYDEDPVSHVAAGGAHTAAATMSGTPASLRSYLCVHSRKSRVSICAI